LKTPVYLLIGDDLLVREKEKQIRESLQRQIQGEMACQTFHAGENDLCQILTEARNLPFTAAAQWFRITNADRIKKDETEILETYLRHPAKSTALIFEAEDVDARGVFYRLISESGEIYQATKADRQSTVIRFIREKLKSFRKTMTPEAERRLIEETGEQPSFLDSILNQLITYAGDRTEITEEMLDFFEEKLAQADGFKLAEAILSGKTSLALRLLKAFARENGDELILFLGLLHWQFRRFWRASTLLAEGVPESEVLKRCGVHYRQSVYFMRQARALQTERLERAIEGLFRLDWDIKTGRALSEPALEKWIIETTG